MPTYQINIIRLDGRLFRARDIEYADDEEAVVKSTQAADGHAVGEYVGLSGTAAATGTLPVAATPITSSTSVSSHSLFTVRPRAGFAVDRSLFYLTGGYVGGNVSYSKTVSHAAGNFDAGTVSSTKSGWTVGGVALLTSGFGCQA